ncbi:MAG: hypothetical protein ACJAZ2_000215 [Glaciecola sp.]|jgi:hypothetical protein
MINIKNVMIGFFIGVVTISCTSKEKYYEVQGTLVNRRSNEPLAGINVDMLESPHFGSSAQKFKTDSLGQYIVRINSKNDNVYLYFSEQVKTSGFGLVEDHHEQHTINSEGTTTLETTFEVVTPLEIVLVKNGYNLTGSFSTSAKITSMDAIYRGPYEINFYGTEVQRWDYSTMLIYSDSYIHYEITCSENYNSYTVKDSIWVPRSSEILTDTIYY